MRSFTLKTPLTPNAGGTLKDPTLLVLHYTGGGSLNGAVTWLCDRRSRASAHFVVGRDGQTQQLVPLSRVAWHAGQSAWRGRPGCNGFAVGIELVNYGPLRRDRDGTYRSIVGNQVVPGAEVFTGRHKFPECGAFEHWHSYPQAQLDALDVLVAELFTELPSLSEIAGHDDVATPRGRKTDTGPAFDEHMVELQAKFNRPRS